MFVCRAQDNERLSHCAEQGLLQCDYCAWYQSGCGQPHYALPAIRQHYEFGWSLSDNQPVLMHVYQEPYPS